MIPAAINSNPEINALIYINIDFFEPADLTCFATAIIINTKNAIIIIASTKVRIKFSLHIFIKLFRKSSSALFSRLSINLAKSAKYCKIPNFSTIIVSCIGSTVSTSSPEMHAIATNVSNINMIPHTKYGICFIRFFPFPPTISV